MCDVDDSRARSILWKKPKRGNQGLVPKAIQLSLPEILGREEDFFEDSWLICGDWTEVREPEPLRGEPRLLKFLAETSAHCIVPFGFYDLGLATEMLRRADHIVCSREIASSVSATNCRNPVISERCGARDSRDPSS